MIARRKLLIALGAGAVTAPWDIAQGQAKVPRIAYLTGRSAPPDPSADAVRQGLRELGYVEGKNILFEAHYFGDRLDRMPSLVAGIALKADVIVSPTMAVIRAAKQATSSVPIVIVLNRDPIAMGLVTSLARPGGNITGISRLLQELSSKRLELLKEAIPGLTRVSILWNEGAQEAAGPNDYEAAARFLKIQLQSLGVRGPSPDLEGAFQAAVNARSGALIIARNFLLLGHSKRIADLAIKHRLPLMCEGSEELAAGALMSYSENDAASYKRAAVFIDKILKGAKPNDLPIEQAAEFELVINMKTAKAIGLAISKDMLLRAHRVIE